MIAVESVKDARKGPDIDREPRPNAVTLAAMRETRDMMDGTIKAEWNHPPAVKEELKAQLRKMLYEK
ncbi:MAG: hypothetical protein LBD09_01185 [Treponema sp.]|jgi:hypothetical protein|nr:hypothetical protein [Treponema sp.]